LVLLNVIKNLLLASSRFFLEIIAYFFTMQNLPPRLIIIFTLFLNSFIGSCFSQTIPESFSKIGLTPKTIFFTNVLPLNEKGGHLQGIQALGPEMNEFVLSGSSSTYAYFLKVTDQEVAEVVEMDQIPFKHAGGFQVADGLMAVGIEDNEAKDKSKVFIYELRDDQIQDQPNWVIERKGDAKRSTAGAIGIVRQKDRILVGVADWDSKNLDFYSIEEKVGRKSPESPFFSISTAELSRESWVSSEWHSYQNINLLQDKNGDLFLVGLGTDSGNQNVADLFELNFSVDNLTLRKLDSKVFPSVPEVNFKAGAGIFQDEKGKLTVIGCSYRVQAKGVIQVWE